MGRLATRRVNQFHQPHAFLARFRQIVETELPGVTEQLKGEGALRLDLINDVVPTSISGGWQDGDERFELITGRRPFVESVLAKAATSRGIVVRRGETVAGLLAGPSDMRGVPNVIGVRTEHGESIEADLVVDIGGRRSVLPTWLGELGARPPGDERDDSGFMYFGRHFRARNESLPALIGVFRWDWDTISSLCLPADNGTWCLGLVIHAKDKALYGLRRLDRWEAALRSIKLVAHWLDGEPIDDGVSVLTRLEDRHRDLSVDGRPVATGVVAVGDAWAATNPSLGRGASIGAMHAIALRETIRDVGLDSPARFACSFHQATAGSVERWYRSTLAQDRHRLARVEAGIYQRPFADNDTGGGLVEALFQLAPFNPDLLRPALDIRLLLRHPDEVFQSDPNLADRVRTLAADGGRDGFAGLVPDRRQLVTIANG